MPPLNFQVILPLTVLIIWTMLLLLVDLFIKDKRLTALLAAFGSRRWRWRWREREFCGI